MLHLLCGFLEDEERCMRIIILDLVALMTELQFVAHDHNYISGRHAQLPTTQYMLHVHACRLCNHVCMHVRHKHSCMQIYTCMQRRQSGLKSGGCGSGSKKFRFFQANFREISIFSGDFTKNFDFSSKFVKKIDVFMQISQKFRLFKAIEK